MNKIKNILSKIKKTKVSSREKLSNTKPLSLTLTTNKKWKLFFQISRAVAMLFFAAAVAAVIAIASVDLETLRDDITAQLRTATGLPVTIEGALSWRVSVNPRIQLRDVRIANATWAKNKNGFEAQSISVRLNLFSLMRDTPVIQSVRINDATINLEKNSAGQYSLEPASAATVPARDENIISQYPFATASFGNIGMRNVRANIDGTEYIIDGFDMRRRRGGNNEIEYTGWVNFKDTVYPFAVSFSEYDGDNYPIKAALSIDDDPIVADIKMSAKKTSFDFHLTGTLDGEILPLSTPDIAFDVSGVFAGQKITLKKSTLTSGASDITLSGSVDWAGDIPNITANISSENINLTDLFPELYDGIGPDWVRPNRDLNVFKDISLYGAELSKYNGTLKIDTANLVVYRDLKVSDIGLDIKLSGAKLRTDVRAKFAGGDVHSAVEISSDEHGVLFARGAGYGAKISVGNIMNEINVNDLISGLPMGFEFYLVGHGKNLSELMATVTGPIAVYSNDVGYAHSDLVSYMYGSDFITDLRHSIEDLFRSDKEYDQMKISCATINMKLRNGVVETKNGIAIESSAINLRVAGYADLGRETLRAQLISTPVRGIKLSITGNVINSIEIEGNMAEPEIRVFGAAIAGKVATSVGIGLLLAPFTGGLSVIAGAGVGFLAGDLIENWLADSAPCKTAMERGAPAMNGDATWLNSPRSELVEKMLRGK